MKYFLLLLSLLTPFSMEAYRPKKSTPIQLRHELNESDHKEQEMLASRRIHCLWKDREFALMRQQIYEFFDRFPASSERDLFQAHLGNIALFEKDYEAALAAYDAIRDHKKRDAVRTKRWQALYQMQKYDLLQQEITPLLPLLKGKEKYEAYFLFAEATFRDALNLSHHSQSEQKAKRLADKALPYYEALIGQPKYAAHAKLATAEIHRLLDHPREAATLYLELAKNETENEALLFHAGAMLARFDEVQATQVFRQVAYMGGTRSAEACFQWMQLLAKRKDFFPLFSEKALFLTKLPSYRLPLFHFYVGMVQYQDKKWKEAADPLAKSIDLGLLFPYEKNALLALVVCGHELGDVELVEKAYDPIYERYVEDICNVDLLRALTYKKVGRLDEALGQFEKLITAKQSASVVERSFREKALILIEKELWNEAYSCCLDYLEKFEEGEMIKLAINLALRHLQQDEGFTKLVNHIELGMKKQIFSDSEKSFYQKILAKGMIKVERYSDALKILEDLEESAERESLLALCALKEGFSPQKIIDHGERALKLDPDLPEKDRLHLYLFNAYLDAAKKNNDANLNHFAEEHLYSIIHSYPVSLENRLWLAHRFAKNEEKKERAIEIFEELLYSSSQVNRFPREAFVLANLFTEKEEHSKAGNLLKQLVAIEESSSFGEEIRLALAHHYRETKEERVALDLYSKLRDSTEPMVAASAKLEYCRLLYHMLPENCSLEELTPILDSLKKLWIKKRIITEPVHLEAALDYFFFQKRFLKKKELLAIAKEIQEHFLLEEDIWSKDYHTTRYQMPSRDLIYQAYMRYIEGLVAELEGERKTASALYSTLCQGKYAVSKYLVELASQGVR